MNKGIGRSVEFHGLTLGYIYLLVGGLLGLLLLSLFLSSIGISGFRWIALFGVVAAFFVWRVFALSKRYGEYGLMKREARGYMPRYIINRRSIGKLIKIREKIELPLD